MEKEKKSSEVSAADLLNKLIGLSILLWIYSLLLPKFRYNALIPLKGHGTIVMLNPLPSPLMCKSAWSG